MTGTQALVLFLLVAAFAAGWLARGSDLEDQQRARRPRRLGRRRGSAGEAPHADATPLGEVVAGAPPGGIGAATAPLVGVEDARRAQELPEPTAPPPAATPQPRDVALRALDLAVAAYEAAVDRWLDEGATISPAGRATLGELDRAIRRLDLAAGRLDAAPGDHAREAGEARIALATLRDAADLLGRYREGEAIDAAADRQLRELEDEVAQARQALAGELP